MSNNSKADEVLAQVLEKALEVAEKTGEFVTDHAPEVIQQLLAWKFAEAVIVFVLTSLLLGIFAYGIYAAIKNNENYEADWVPAIFTLSVVGGVVALMFWCMALMNMVMIWVAPKVYLLEYASMLLR